MLLPRSGAQASIGQDCQRGADVAGPILKSLGLPDLQLMNADTETNVDVARTRAEKLIADGAQLLVGAFDSGQSTAIAQVAEQKGIPFVINIAAAPPITEQGYKFVFRNFPTAPMILADAFANQKEVFEASRQGAEDRRVHARQRHLRHRDEERHRRGDAAFQHAVQIAETIAYDPTARDLSVEVAKAKATGAEALLMVSRLNDAILITRELVKQRWSPMGILSMGPGWYEDQYLKTLGKLADGPLSFVPWYDPNKKVSKLLEAAIAKAHPGINVNTNHIYTFEALQIAADAYKRAGSADPQKLADAIRADQYHRQRQHRPGHPVRRQGPERQAEELGDPEPRRQARHGRAEGRDQRHGAVPDGGVRQALSCAVIPARA